MKRSILILLIIAFISAVLPLQINASETESKWRQRLPVGSENTSDVDEELRFGREVAARILGRYNLDENHLMQKYVNLVGHTLTQNANRPEIEFRFAVLNTDEINAYAAPGGYVFVTRGALSQMHDEAELAGVLAHEIGHIIGKHVVKELGIKGADDSAVSGLARVIGGSTDAARAAFTQAVDKAMDMLFKDGYKREDEVQADRDSVLLCALSGYDPSGLARYFERLNTVKGKQTEVIDRTHPAFTERIASINSVITQEGITADDYKTYKERFADAMKRSK
jgi:beta-barrel assembly-enhancing protease